MFTTHPTPPKKGSLGNYSICVLNKQQILFRQAKALVSLLPTDVRRENEYDFFCFDLTCTFSAVDVFKFTVV